MLVHNYRAFGLNICSEIECNDVLPGVERADAHIRIAAVPERLENASSAGVFYEAAQGTLLLNVKDVARYLVMRGSEILVSPASGADHDRLRILLFGSAFGALLHQRGIVTLHGSAIVTDHGAVVFSGPSGCGKSTLAAAFHQRGYPVLADEISPVNGCNSPAVLPANPYLQLWADAVDGLQLSTLSMRRARLGLEKYIVPVRDHFATAPVPLHAIYMLEDTNSDETSVVPVRGLEKIRVLNAAFYKPHFIEGMELAGQHSRQAARIAGQVKIGVVKRPRSGFRVEELADLLAADFGA